MEEKSLEFFEKYEITVTGTARARGAFCIDTEGGPKLLLPYSGSEQRAVFEQSVFDQGTWSEGRYGSSLPRGGL